MGSKAAGAVEAMETERRVAERRAQLGPAIQWSRLDVLELSIVTPQDVQAARAFFHTYAPHPYKTLVDARKEHPRQAE